MFMIGLWSAGDWGANAAQHESVSLLNAEILLSFLKVIFSLCVCTHSYTTVYVYSYIMIHHAVCV